MNVIGYATHAVTFAFEIASDSRPAWDSAPSLVPEKGPEGLKARPILYPIQHIDTIARRRYFFFATATIADFSKNISVH